MILFSVQCIMSLLNLITKSRQWLAIWPRRISIRLTRWVKVKVWSAERVIWFMSNKRLPMQILKIRWKALYKGYISRDRYSHVLLYIKHIENANKKSRESRHCIRHSSQKGLYEMVGGQRTFDPWLYLSVTWLRCQKHFLVKWRSDNLLQIYTTYRNNSLQGTTITTKNKRTLMDERCVRFWVKIAFWDSDKWPFSKM